MLPDYGCFPRFRDGLPSNGRVLWRGQCEMRLGWSQNGPGGCGVRWEVGPVADGSLQMGGRLRITCLVELKRVQNGMHRPRLCFPPHRLS